jgi:hypothetical protein
MSDDVQNIDVSSEVSTPVTQAPTPEVQAPQTAQTQNEKMLPQSQVTKIAASENRAGYEKARRELEAQYGIQNPANSKPSIDPEEIKRIARETYQAELKEQALKHQQMLEQQEADRVHSALAKKIEDATTKYEDFNTVVQEFDYVNELKDVLYAVNNVDNSGDVLYHLSKDPAKLKELVSDLRTPGFQRMAMKKINELSDSIRNRESAKNRELPPEPLSQLKPLRNTGNGEMSVSDYAARYMV